MSLCHQCGVALRESDRFCPSCGAASGDGLENKDPLVGRTIGGAYVVLELVGVGGMGRVYRAEQRMLGRTVAIKVVHPHLLSDEQSVARFYTEARAASSLNHPNSVSIIDFGRTDDGILYLVMEFLQGADLAHVMREEGLLGFERICGIVEDVLAALGEAHALGVVHRDLKPENVIIEHLRTGGDLIKVVDFGLAKVLSGSAEETNITLPGLVCGTPDYMSPEQGRGEEVDGRGDIYAAGVLLFELLTDQLPFVADTPTNVVLRHIQDPIPDPREVAPDRRIPPALATITTKALAKSPADRFQSAEEMAEALRGALREPLRVGEEISCPSCGMSSPAGKRFCGECGFALSSAPAPAPAASPKRMSLPPRVSMSAAGPCVGRDEELDRIAQLAREGEGALISVLVLGESGVGKTRLLAEVAERSSEAGDLVVGAGPHPSGAPVPYYPIRAVMLSLFAVDEQGLEQIAAEREPTDALVAAGLREVLRPRGIVGGQGQSAASAVAAALAMAIANALDRARSGRLVLLFDDLFLGDGLTPQVLRALPSHLEGQTVLLLMAAHVAKPKSLPRDTHSIGLTGLDPSHAREFMGELPAGSVPPDQDGEAPLLLPLYLDRLRRLGLDSSGIDATAPSRIADAIHQQLQRLDLPSRRLLQAAAVLGQRSSRATLADLVTDADLDSFGVLAQAALLVEEQGEVSVFHPFIRDLVEASIPAEARRLLHARALEALASAEIPLEERAHHAYGAGESMTALMLLDRMGELAYQRGDPDTSTLAYRRATEIARRELLETGDPSLEGALASFGRKLGRALMRRGDYTGAEGVLREALEFCGPRTSHRANILLELARVVGLRRKMRDAYRLLGEALEIAIQCEDDEAQAAAHSAVGELRRTEGNFAGAVSSLTSAFSLLAPGAGPVLERARIGVELAETLLACGDREAAVGALSRARKLVSEADARLLEARCHAIESELKEQQGALSAARRLLQQGAHTAALAGDAVLARRLSRSAESARLAGADRPLAN